MLTKDLQIYKHTNPFKHVKFTIKVPLVGRLYLKKKDKTEQTRISYKFVVFVIAATAVKKAPLHATAKGAQGVALELTVGCAVNDRVFEVVVRDAEMLQVRDERGRVKRWRHWIHLIRSYIDVRRNDTSVKWSII